MEILCTAVLGSETFSNLPDVRMEQVYQNVIKAEFLGSGFPPIDRSKIRDIRVPTLLISGENSPKIFPLLLDRLQQLLPNVRHKVIPGASHISHEDNVYDFNQNILSFIEEHRH